MIGKSPMVRCCTWQVNGSIDDATGLRGRLEKERRVYKALTSDSNMFPRTSIASITNRGTPLLQTSDTEINFNRGQESTCGFWYGRITSFILPETKIVAFLTKSQTNHNGQSYPVYQLVHCSRSLPLKSIYLQAYNTLTRTCVIALSQ